MIYVSSTSNLESFTSPVSSLTLIPSSFNHPEKFPTTSETRAFIGATYTILKDQRLNSPFSLQYTERVCKIASIAIFVLPAPVGAQTRRFSEVLKAVSNNQD